MGRGKFEGDGHAPTCLMTLCCCQYKNGWTDRDAVWDMDSGGPKKACLDAPCKGATFRGKVMAGHARPTTLWRQLCKSDWTYRDAILIVDSGEPKEACVTWGTHWRSVSNVCVWRRCCLMSNYFDQLLMVTPLRRTLYNPNVLVAVSKGMGAVKVCSHKTCQFSTGGAG